VLKRARFNQKRLFLLWKPVTVKLDALIISHVRRVIVFALLVRSSVAENAQTDLHERNMILFRTVSIISRVLRLAIADSNVEADRSLLPAITRFR